MPFRSRTYKIKYQLTTRGHKQYKHYFSIKHKHFQKHKIQ